MGATRWAAALGLAALALSGPGCRETPRPAREGADPMPRRPIVAVLQAHTPRLMALPGVVGTYQGETDAGAPCIRVMVVALTPALRDSVPAVLEGWPVELEETGEIRPL